MSVTIVTQQGSHLLIAADQERYAVIERREGRYYNCHDAARAGIPVDALAEIGTVLEAGDWADRDTAQAAFEAITQRGAELAQRML
jgi:hypothetical protein